MSAQTPSIPAIENGTPISPRREQPSTFLMNDIPRGTSLTELIRSLASEEDAIYPLILAALEQEPVLVPSVLDDGLSVTTIQFKYTPGWLSDDRHVFLENSEFGTLWKGVNLTATDVSGRTEFFHAASAGNLQYAETLAEFADTDINAQDHRGLTARQRKTPLQLAIERGNQAVVRILRRRLPSPEVSRLEIEADGGKEKASIIPEVARHALKANSGTTEKITIILVTLHDAAEMGNEWRVVELLNEGAKIEE